MDARRLVPLVALLLTFASPPSAWAQSPEEHETVIDLGRDGRVVLQDDDELSVCAVGGSGGSCSSGNGVPLVASRSLLNSTAGQNFVDLGGVVYGLVSPDVASVEVVLGDRSVQPAQIVRRTLRGVEGVGVVGLGVGKAAVRLIRLRDGVGRLLRAEDPSFGERIVGVPRTLARVDGARMRAYRGRQLTGSFLDPESEETFACLRYRGARVCGFVAGQSADEIVPASSQSCAGQTVVALLPPATRRVRLLLGSGRTRTVTAHDATGVVRLPARAFGTLVPPDEALRSITALGASGRALGTAEVGLAPAAIGCSSGSSSFSFGFGPGDDGVTAPTNSTVVDDGPPAAHVGFGSSAGRPLPCLGIDGAPLADDCVTDVPGFLTAITVPEGVRIRGFVEAPITTVVAVLADGRELALRVAADPERLPVPLTGRARTVVGTLPTGAVVRRFIARVASGRSVPEGLGVFGDSGFGPARTVVRSGRFRLTARDVRVHPAAAPDDCFTLLGPGLPDTDDSSCSVFGVRAYSDCRTRRIVLFGTISRTTTRALHVTTTDGERRTLRPVRAGRSGRVVLLALPRDAGVRRLVRQTARTRSAALERMLPSPRRQCGYTHGIDAFRL